MEKFGDSDRDAIKYHHGCSGGSLEDGNAKRNVGRGEGTWEVLGQGRQHERRIRDEGHSLLSGEEHSCLPIHPEDLVEAKVRSSELDCMTEGT